MSTGGMPSFGSLAGQSRRPDIPSGLAAGLTGAPMQMPQAAPMQMSAAPMPDMSGGRIPVSTGGVNLSNLFSAADKGASSSSSDNWGTGPGQRNPLLRENQQAYKQSQEYKDWVKQMRFDTLSSWGGVSPSTGKYYPHWGPNGYEGGTYDGMTAGGSAAQSAASAAAQKDAEAFIKSLFG